MGLHDSISIGAREKHVIFWCKFICVEGDMLQYSITKMSFWNILLHLTPLNSWTQLSSRILQVRISQFAIYFLLVCICVHIALCLHTLHLSTHERLSNHEHNCETPISSALKCVTKLYTSQHKHNLKDHSEMWDQTTHFSTPELNY